MPPYTQKPGTFTLDGTPSQQQPQQPPLAFAPPAAQPVGSDLLGVLSAIAGLGLNIAGAATQTGAAGQGTLNFAQQQLAQGAENKREQQRAGQEQSEAEKLYKQAVDSGIRGSDLDVIRQFGENRRIGEMRSEIDRQLNNLKQKQTDSKEEKRNFADALKADLDEKVGLVRNDPSARFAAAAEQLKANPKALDNDASLETLLRGLRVEGAPAFSNKDDLKLAVEEIKKARKAAKGGPNWLNYLSRGALGKVNPAQPIDSAIEGVVGTTLSPATNNLQYLREIRKLDQKVRRTPHADRSALRSLQDEYEAIRAKYAAPAQKEPASGTPAGNAPPPPPQEVERFDPASGKTAVFDAQTKKFLRFK